MEPLLLVNNVEDFLTLERHIYMCHAQRIGNSSRDRRSGTDSTGLTHALHAKWVNCRQRHGVVKLKLRELRSYRHGVVHKSAGQELTIFAIFDSFPHRLSNALCDTAVNLSLHEHRIKLATTVINCDEACQVYISGLFVYLNNSDMRAKGEDTGFRLKEDGRL